MQSALGATGDIAISGVAILIELGMISASCDNVGDETLRLLGDPKDGA